jgi:hypothetical protein
MINVWAELHEALSSSDKEEFTRLVNLILSHTFIIRNTFNQKSMSMKINPDYRFVERHYDLFLDYLHYAGWALLKENDYGVIALENAYEQNRIRLGRGTTLILYILKLIFEEEREKVTLRHEILTTTGQIVQKMITLGLIPKRPAIKDLTESLRQLSYHNIIEKMDGPWHEPDTKILILPSILLIVSNASISRLQDEIAEGEDGTDDEDIAGEDEDDL